MLTHGRGEDSKKNEYFSERKEEARRGAYLFVAELLDVLTELLQLCVRGHAASGNVVRCSTQSHTQLLILLPQITQLPQTLTLLILQSLQATAQVLLQL